MSKNSMGAKLEGPYEKIKGGLKDVSRNLTKADPEPVIGMSGLSSGEGSPVVPHPSKTKDELYADARRLGIKGRSKMTKHELEQAIRRA
jgi:hypothetical protein